MWWIGVYAGLIELLALTFFGTLFAGIGLGWQDEGQRNIVRFMLLSLIGLGVVALCTVAAFHV